MKNNKSLVVQKLINQGVRIFDDERVEIRGSLVCGNNVFIDINTIFEGSVVLADNVSIGSNCIIKDSIINQDSLIKPFTSIEGASIGKNTFIGPYARIREGTKVADFVQIGNFVEIKNSTIKDQCRINHHSFIGDADLDEGVTIGAGTITCNHDGHKINSISIGKNAYVGSGCNLIAPIRIGSNATIGAGSTISEDVPKDKLTIARAHQMTYENWKGPKHNKTIQREKDK
jgi:bifunctional UDP-N-acetylglucosamine pyrophosphorylase / glucosamine-1-phosphate N-acetyltransferase